MDVLGPTISVLIMCPCLLGHFSTEGYCGSVAECVDYTGVLIPQVSTLTGSIVHTWSE